MKTEVSRPPASLVASRLLELLRSEQHDLIFVGRSETASMSVAKALAAIAPDVETVVFRPWDCLPYDRVAPSREVMGQRMDALRVWLEHPTPNRIFLTSLDALLQRVPPADVVIHSHYRLTTGTAFDRPSFETFTGRAGYLTDAVVDEPGEATLRNDFVEIYPAGGDRPMRIVVGASGDIEELRFYDPATQRTIETVETMDFGPASELILNDAGDLDADSTTNVPMEERLHHRYPAMPCVLELLPPSHIVFASGAADRVDGYLDIISEAKAARIALGGGKEAGSSIYLSKSEWEASLQRHHRTDLDPAGWKPLPESGPGLLNGRRFEHLLAEELAQQRRVLITGQHPRLRRWLQRMTDRLAVDKIQAANWNDVCSAAGGKLLVADFDLEQGFVDAAAALAVITATDLFGADMAAAATTAATAATALSEPELHIGDVVVHQDHGLGILRGLETVEVDGVPTDAARLEYHGASSILVPMRDFGRLWRYGSMPEAVTLDRLHTDAWEKKRATVYKQIQISARKLVRFAKERQAGDAAKLVPETTPYSRFVARFPYAETPDQTAAIQAVLSDLSSGKRTNRLICGDVGFGKTEIALRAVAAAAFAGYQAVVLVPTTVLAKQHFLTFERRFQGTGIKVALLSRLLSPAQTKAVKAELKSGETRIVIGTSALLAKDVSFDRLGLLVIDEEHKFGARDKASIRSLAPQLHSLMMTATPIPRTLQHALVGLQDVSLLTTPPAKRRPVRTFLAPFDRATMRTALLREHRRDGQSFVIVPRIEDIDTVKDELAAVAPELSLKVAHGKMPADAVDEVMVSFANGDGDVLLSTNIIESGLDVPRANTIFVWNAERFGLAQLHQLRGRVGRGRAQGIAYLLAEDDQEVAEDTRSRLSVLVSNDRLGSGLAISQQDLDLRGTGDLFGEDQAGHVKVIGTSLYQKMLTAAVGKRGAGTDFLERPEVSIGIEGRIPEDYVPDAAVRLNLYSKLLKLVDPAAVDDMAEELEDRFGEPPEDIDCLLRMTKVTIAMRRLGVTAVQGGPSAVAFKFAAEPGAKIKAACSRHGRFEAKGERYVLAVPTETGSQRLGLLEQIFGSIRPGH